MCQDGRRGDREPDTFAFALLKKTGRSPAAFATAMRALEKSHRRNDKTSTLRKKIGLPDDKPSPDRPDDADTGSKPKFGYLSTHPDTADRIRAAEAAAAADAR